jgi:hypothetical protein
MKLTEKHVSEEILNLLINSYQLLDRAGAHNVVLMALLELKQRRNEDRRGENDGK